MNEIRFKKADTVRVIAELASYIDSLEEGREYVLTVKEHKEKRSLNANAYCWTLLDRLAEKLRIGKTELYRNFIKDVGGNAEVICIQNKALARFKHIWELGHVGRFVEEIPSKLEGCTNLIVYTGSSDFDKAEMSRLIELIVAECKENGIPTWDEDELQRLCDEWGCDR